MKKFLMALLLMIPMSTYALDVDFVSDVTVASHGVVIGMDQDGDEFSVGGTSCGYFRYGARAAVIDEPPVLG